MTESIQKKLLRVRPPRVKITYDVEIGNAIEKKELPFIVGIFADLKGDREDPENYQSLKLRTMYDIDRDNFNDLMHAIAPRAAFSPTAFKGWAGDAADTDDKALTFNSIDAFEPLNIVQAMPSLAKLYTARGQIRSLQAKAESDDTFAKHLDAMVQGGTAADQARHANLLTTPASVPLQAKDTPALVTRLFGLHNDLQDTDAKLLPTLKAWRLLPANAVETDVPGAKPGALVLARALSATDTEENRSKAIVLLKELRGKAAATLPASKPAEQAAGTAQGAAATQAAAADPDAAAAAAAAETPAAPAAPASPFDPRLALLGFADGAAASAQLNKAKSEADLQAAIRTSQGDTIWTLPLLLLGLTDKASNNDAAYLSTFEFYNYLLNDPVAPTTADELVLTAKEILPLIETDTARSILAINYFVGCLRSVTGQENTSARIQAAQRKGAAAVIDELVAGIDVKLSKSLSDIMHSASFKKMEATWRGLHYLVFNTETSTMLRLRVLNADKAELLKDMQKAVEFDQSVLFKKIYEDEYGTYGGMPYSLLIGDYEIGRGNNDIEFLKKISEVAAAAHAPFIAQASKDLFALNSFADLGKPRDLKKIFESEDFGGWRDFRDMEDARYVTLALPRALLRLPYGTPDKRNTIECEGLNFNEEVGPPASASKLVNANGTTYYASPDNENFLWGNPAYLLAERITNAFSLYSWTAAIRGVEGGGLVEGLPRYTYTSDTGSTELFCPTEVSITDRREKELNDLGFISLCHCKGTAKAAFFGGQTTNLPKKYFSDDANANARISAMLPYMLAASRFAHYIKVIMREKIGSALTRANIENYLNTWISNYVLLDDNATHEVKSSYPLRSAKVAVTDVPGEPGVYRATVFLKPHFQLEELTTSIRLVAEVPK